MTDDVLIINEGLRSTTSKSGRTRFHVKIRAEPIAVNTSKEALGGPVANAIAHHLRERVLAIAAVASPATLKIREVEQRAFRRGEAWAMRKFSGGRTGPMEPNQTNRQFNSSGRFPKSITANADSHGNWRVNVAANRLDPRTAGEAGVQRIWQRLVELVPEFGDARKLIESDIIRKTMERTARGMIQKARATEGKVQMGVARALFQTLGKLSDLGSALAR